MYGDFSRDVSSVPDGYRRVLLQQGRVLLDADYNDQVAIMLQYQQQLIRALTTVRTTSTAEPGGAMATSALAYATTGDNFRVIADKLNGLKVKRGWYFVDGLLASAEAEEAVPLEFGSGRAYLLYLDVWEQCVTAAEDKKGEFREPALDGADTTIRTRVQHRVSQWELKEKDYNKFCSDLAPQTRALRKKLQENARVQKPNLAITIPKLKTPMLTVAGPSPEFALRRLMLVLSGVLPLLLLIILSFAWRSWPDFFDIAVATAFVLVSAVLLHRDTLPEQIANQQREQQKAQEKFLEKLGAEVAKLSKNLEADYSVLVGKYNMFVNNAVNLLLRPRELEEMTGTIGSHFSELVRAKHRTMPQLRVQDSHVSVEEERPIYRGWRNQLYRVEIHQGGDGKPACFKWSRHNGSLLFAVEDEKPSSKQPRVLDTKTKTINIVARQAESDAINGHWVELLPADETGERTPQLRKVTEVNYAGQPRTLTLTLDMSATRPEFVRVWDHQPESTAAPTACPHGTIPVGDCSYLLEDGLEIKFTSKPDEYRPGDYWLIKVRPGEPIIYKEEAQCTPHYYAPLALVSFDDKGAPTLVDCRLVIQSSGLLSEDGMHQFLRV